MKKYLINGLIILVLSGVLLWFLPWWTIGIVPFLVILFGFRMKGFAFPVGFLAIGLIWMGYSLWRVDAANPTYVNALGELLTLPSGSIVWVNTLLGGLIGGLSAWSGKLLRVMLRPERK